MTPSLTIGIFVLGAVMLLLALVSGGFKIFGSEIPGVAGRSARIIAFFIGVILVGFSLLHFREEPIVRGSDDQSQLAPPAAKLASAGAVTNLPPAQNPSRPKTPRAEENRITPEACASQSWGQQTLTSGEAKDYLFSMDRQGRAQAIVSEIRQDWTNYSSSQADHPGIPEVYVRLCNSSDQNGCSGAQFANDIPYQRILTTGPARVQVTHFSTNPEPISYTISISCPSQSR